MLTLVRLALRDLAHQRAFSVFFVVNLALGLSGALLLDALQGSVGRTLEGRSRAILGADIRVTSTRSLSADEIRKLDAAAGAAASADVVQLYSMVSGPKLARLAEVRGIDDGFPLHGAIVLAGAGSVGDAEREKLDARAEAWADPALLDQLGAKLGDSVKVGTQTFVLADTIVRDTGMSMRAASLAPRLYVSLPRIATTGLVQTGSRVEHQHLLALPAGADAEVAAARMSAIVADPRVRITTHTAAVNEISGAYSRVTRYLGLVSLVALALAGIASAYLFHAFLRRRLADLAILMSLGARRRRAQLLMLLEVSMLAAASSALAVGVVMGMLPGVAYLVSDLLPAELVLGVSMREAATALGIALVVGPVSCLPVLARLGTMRVAALFQERVELGLAQRPRDALWMLPAAGVFFALAVWRVGDVVQGAYFTGVMFASFLLALGAGWLLLPFIVRAGARARVSVRIALRQLSPARRGSRTAFTALTLTALLLGLPPQLRALLMQQLDPPGEASTPSLFLFDIQPEQAEPLVAHLREAGTGVQRMAPMVRARLVAINGKAVGAADGKALAKGIDDSASARAADGRERTGVADDDENREAVGREASAAGASRDDAVDEDGEATEQRTGDSSGASRTASSQPSGFRDAERLASRNYNLTWQQDLHSTEKLVEGAWFSGTWDESSGELPEISMEIDFAERLDLSIGDRMRFDVQGVPVDGRIVNFRKVDWTSLQPNFFVSFQPGVLEVAPSVFLASVPALAPNVRETLQTSLVEKFPNVSMIDVTRGVERVLGLLEQLRWAVAATAWAALAVGLVLVFAIARDEADERRWDINLMKVLGAPHALLRTSVAVEFAALAAAATFVGCGVALAACAALARAVLEVDWSPWWPPLVSVAVVLPALASATALLAMRRVLRTRPALTL
jgi:putative ABC transport system permease protein